MGATRAVGVDVDPMAISSASYNASLNMIEDHRFQVFLADMNGGNPVPPGAAYHPVYDNSMDEEKETCGSDFDLVVANILANPLVELSDQIASYARPGGIVGLSGILVDQVRTPLLYFNISLHYSITINLL
jgi:ribosomal protein L11 methylase PrmA